MDSDFNRISPHTKGNCIGSRDRESSTDHLDSAGFKNFGSETPKELVPFSTAASLWPVLPRCDGKRLPQCCRIWYLLRIGNQIFDFFHRTYIIISIISVYQWIDVAHCPQSISFFSSTYLPPCRLQSRGPVRKTSMDTRQAFLVSMVKVHYWRQAVHLLDFRKAWGSSQLIRKADLLPAMQVTWSWLKALIDEGRTRSQ